MTAKWAIVFYSSNVSSIQSSIIIIFKKNVHLTGGTKKRCIILFYTKKCSLCYACIYSYLFIVVILIILIKTMFLRLFVFPQILPHGPREEKKGLFSVIFFQYFVSREIYPTSMFLTTENLFSQIDTRKKRILMQCGYSEVWCLL